MQIQGRNIFTTKREYIINFQKKKRKKCIAFKINFHVPVEFLPVFYFLASENVADYV